MRFAYIDSQGNEVSIPSVDALALRIELGAIGPDTQLYDEVADRWGPAHTHEIFHTLSRAKEEEGFVAPPPPGVPTPPPPLGSTGEATPTGGPPPEPAAAEEPAAQEESAPDVELAGAGASAGEAAGGAPGQAAETGPPEQEDVPLDFTLIEPSATAQEAGEANEPVEAVEGDEEPSPESEVSGEPEILSAADEVASEGLVEPSAHDLGAGGFDLDLEPDEPMPGFTAGSPPAWMEQDGPEGEGAMDLVRRPVDASGGSDAESQRPYGSDRPPRTRPRPRSRPSPPRRRRRFPVGVVAALVVVAALGVGGWYGWPFFQSWWDAHRPSTQPQSLRPVTLPEIPRALLPRMRTLGDAALAGTISELRTEEATMGLPAEPRSAWLGGAYLSNASQYPDIRRYWVLIDSLVAHVRSTDAEVFHDQYVKQLDSAGITGDTASMLLARADSGFLATRAVRLEAYNQMDDLTNAALDLHQFLLAHEADIRYAPAAGGVSQDPVLEAVPKTPQLGQQMWAMVDRITAALNQLGTLDKVTTERLSGVLFDKIRAAGFE